jgi:hypothetical protein
MPTKSEYMTIEILGTTLMLSNMVAPNPNNNPTTTPADTRL